MPNLQFTQDDNQNIVHLVNAVVRNDMPGDIVLCKTDGTSTTIPANFGYGLFADFDITKITYAGKDYFPFVSGPPSPTGMTSVAISLAISW
jgi:hypothetical protein